MLLVVIRMHVFFFFFQAEDGIRDYKVTGVQTCALPILSAVIGAMGIVYGDIGTSPLYALQSALDAAGGFDAEVVLGVLSLIFWSLAISVTLKYVTVIMRADNEGEGGILALFALAQRRLITGSTWAKVAVALALIGTAFFFCDALITPDRKS